MYCAMASAGVILFCTLLFLLYEWSVGRESIARGLVQDEKIR
jgi:hypothetical protein